ncbi:MAG: hypothetical protein JXB32_16690 [Deltaproteobacteria bacterium]|nr:hypothetical protein [Deltaproteobacteria bacterium]
MADEVRDGLGALPGRHRRLVKGGALASCSIDLEAAIGTEAVARFDYLIASDLRTVAMEVHPATPGEVKTMVAKKRGTAGVLDRDCPWLVVDRWAWIVPFGATLGILRGTVAERQLATAGIGFPDRRLRLST